MSYQPEAPMWIVDTETLAFTAMNDSAVVLLGLAKDVVLRMNAIEVMPLADRERLLSAIRQEASAGDGGEWTYPHPSGRSVRVRIRFHTIEEFPRKRRFAYASEIYGHPAFPDGPTVPIGRYAAMLKPSSDRAVPPELCVVTTDISVERAAASGAEKAGLGFTAKPQCTSSCSSCRSIVALDLTESEHAEARCNVLREKGGQVFIAIIPETMTTAQARQRGFDLVVYRPLMERFLPVLLQVALSMV